MTGPIVIDIGTAALPDIKDYVEKIDADLTDLKADGRLKDADKIAADLEAKKAKRIADADADYAARLEKGGLDLDLLRLTAIGVHDVEARVTLCRTEAEEKAALIELAKELKDAYGGLRTVITYGGHNFDLPALMRRARFLSVPFPVLSTDRFKSMNRDLLLELSDRNPQRSRPLAFYVKRLKMGLVKPLSGDEEAKVFDSGLWAELEQSVRHDLEATRQLAVWLGIL